MATTQVVPPPCACGPGTCPPMHASSSAWHALNTAAVRTGPKPFSRAHLQRTHHTMHRHPPTPYA